jgi:hypothetical protein
MEDSNNLPDFALNGVSDLNPASESRELINGYSVFDGCIRELNSFDSVRIEKSEAEKVVLKRHEQVQ